MNVCLLNNTRWALKKERKTVLYASCSIAKSTNFDSEESYLNFQNMAYVSFFGVKDLYEKNNFDFSKRTA